MEAQRILGASLLSSVSRNGEAQRTTKRLSQVAADVPKEDIGGAADELFGCEVPEAAVTSQEGLVGCEVIEAAAIVLIIFLLVCSAFMVVLGIDIWRNW